MRKTAFWLETSDQVKLFIRKWTAPGNTPKAIVQIAHGMAEHTNRYDSFARYLVERNIFVYGNDLRGHGKTGEKQGQLGYFADQDGFKKVTEDLHEVTGKIREDHPDVPIILLGHSFGSFLARKYLQTHSSRIAGVILSGTGSHPGKVRISAAMAFTRKEMKRKGTTSASPFLNRIVFGANGKCSSDLQKKFSWLTRDEEAVRRYVDDPLCGFVPSTSFFYDLFSGFNLIYNQKENNRIPKKLPIQLISGSEDPIGKKGTGIFRLMNDYNDLGLENVTCYIYEEGRHEMLNEINRQEVFKDIEKWINRIIT